jgi:hypothetical protein
MIAMMVLVGRTADHFQKLDVLILMILDFLLPEL